MKRKLFLEPWVLYVGGVFLFVGGPITAGIFAWGCYTLFIERGSVGYLILGVVFPIALLADVIWLTITMVGPRVDYLIVAEEYVEWHGLFRRKKVLYYRDCPFIGIETFNKEAQCPVVRGDECAMIYLSTEPYPEKMRGLINHLYCSESFIKFRYTDKLALALLEVMPKERSYAVLAFYNRIQAFNREMQRRRKKRKQRKK